ncbi:MAG: 3'-5' exonuclease [Chloroflexi bacterium]|nr:3'-5' exonuclease [Chloroflexota bacterium]
MLPIKLTRPLVSIDLETTGVDVENDRILQIALITLHPDGKRDSKCRLIDPGVPIPKEATAVHGIRTEDIVGKLAFSLVARSLQKLLSGCDITGYNVAGFDVPMLSAEFKRCGITWPEEGTKIVDSMAVFRVQEPQKLAQALKFYTGRDIGDDAHDAEVDASAALDVLLGQAQRYIGDERTKLSDMLVLAKDPDWLDSTGKVKRVNGVACINFGKWLGKPLAQVDRGYFDWVAKQDFPEDFKAICKDAGDGIYPEQD